MTTIILPPVYTIDPDHLEVYTSTQYCYELPIAEGRLFFYYTVNNCAGVVGEVGVYAPDYTRKVLCEADEAAIIRFAQELIDMHQPF
jgi:hypothetical protein